MKVKFKKSFQYSFNGYEVKTFTKWQEYDLPEEFVSEYSEILTVVRPDKGSNGDEQGDGGTQNKKPLNSKDVEKKPDEKKGKKETK